MKIKSLLFLAVSAVTVSACGDRAVTNNSAAAKSNAAQSATPVPTSTVPRNADYEGKGVVTKINLEAGSVEMDHEEIKGVMPPMRMEFYVTDKKMLDGLKVGDGVDFILRYKDGSETIVNIAKAKS